MNPEKTTILKVLVGSRAYGLADKDSDWDYRGVYVESTSKILSLEYKYKQSKWDIETDEVYYEIGHFLQLATHCNPTILEVFKAPIQYANEDGVKLVKLFPYVWNPQGVFDAFIGYGLNQRKKMLDKKDNRQAKYAIAYLRTLYSLVDLLLTKDFSLEIDKPKVKEALLVIKKGQATYGSIIDASEELIGLSRICLAKCKHEPNIDKVNEFLIDIRRRYW